MPALTVLMTVYNGERYLRQAVESIVGQTYSDFEFLIVDDGSTDGTADILRAYDDPRIRLLRNEFNVGLSRSLNRGIAAARGDFIARQDADDISEPQRLAAQLAFLRRHPHLALLGSWFTEIDERGVLLGRKQLPRDLLSIRWMLLFVSAFVHSAVMIRRQHLAAVGLYDESLVYAMDFDLWKRIARRYSVANLDQYLVRYRLHPTAMSVALPHYAHEADDLALDGLAPLLGWDNITLSARNNRLRSMAGLLFAASPSIPLHRLPGTVREIWRLHNAFCRRHALSPVAMGQRRWQLLRFLAYRSLLALRRHATLVTTDARSRHAAAPFLNEDSG